MDQASQRELKILTAIAQGQTMTQRGLASSLGIALGLTNLYLKRLIRKGYVKATTIPSNRLTYLLTPHGIAEKTRLTYDYLAFSIALYGETRKALRDALEPLVADRMARFALYGTGEATELAYLTLKEMGLEPVGVYGDNGGSTFLGMHVMPVEQLATAPVDRVIVASFDGATERRVAEVERVVATDKLIVLGRRPQA